MSNLEIETLPSKVSVPWRRNQWDAPSIAELGSEVYLIRLFIVTYNSPETVNANLRSLYAANWIENVVMQINIINNHPNFTLDPEFHNDVIVHDNSLRLKTSVGHLARDYNSALTLGFEILHAPKCHQVIITHDDVIWHKDALTKLMQYHNTDGYNFYAGNFGCSFMSFKPAAVRKIGLFDERFANIGFQEADYFLRALIYNRDKSTINDDTHGRVLNPTEVLFDHPPYTPNKVESREESSKYHIISRKMFADKWNVYPDRWKENGYLDKPPMGPLCSSYFMHPKFEVSLEYAMAKAQKYPVTDGYKYWWYDDDAQKKNVILVGFENLRWNAVLRDDVVRLEEKRDSLPNWKWSDDTEEKSIIKGTLKHDLQDIEDRLVEGGSLEWLNYPM